MARGRGKGKGKTGKAHQNKGNIQTNKKTIDSSQSKVTLVTPTVIKLDSRTFSKEAHTALVELRSELLTLAQTKATKKTKEIQNNSILEELTKEYAKDYQEKASSLVQGLSTYISTWGLHRLSGDMKKFLAGTAEDTIYKGQVYQKFLTRLKKFSEEDFEVNDERTLIHMPLKKYAGLNHLAIKLAKEWSFWSPAVLEEIKQS